MSQPTASRRRVISGGLAALSMLWLPASVRAQAAGYPNKPIRLIVPFAAGSATDTIGRIFGERITAYLGQPVVIDNRPGANGTIAALAVAKAPADGYTLLLGTNTTNSAIRSIMKNVPYDPEKDFSPISFLGVLPQLVCVNATSPHKTLAELIASAKANPEKIAYAWPNTVSKFATEMFASMAGIKLLGVPYKSSPQAMTDLLGDRVELYFSDPVVAGPHIKSGKVRALATTSGVRMQLFPQVPTIAEAGGLKGYEVMGIFATFAPAGTPRDVIVKLNETIRKASADSEVKSKFEAMSLETQLGTPEQMAERFRQETERWTKYASVAGIVPE
jgi:tripartite-type tricarboxylate transporter receptor subunit TctC